MIDDSARRWLLVSVALVVACRQKPANPVVAQVGEVVITAEDFRQQLGKLPAAVRDRYSSLEQKRRILDNLVRAEVLANEARRRGYEKDPEVRRTINQHLAGVLIAREKAAGNPDAVTPEQVQRYIEGHPRDYPLVDEVQVASRCAKDRTAAANAGGRETVSTLRQGTSAQPKDFVDAAMALQKPGDNAGPLAAREGFCTIRLVERRRVFARPEQEIRADVQRLLQQQLLAHSVERLYGVARKRVGVEIHEDELSKLRLE
jgi:hypothetical protein